MRDNMGRENRKVRGSAHKPPKPDVAQGTLVGALMEPKPCRAQTFGLNAVARWKIGDEVAHCLLKSRRGRVELVFTGRDRNGIWVRVKWDDGSPTTEHPQGNVDPVPT